MQPRNLARLLFTLTAATLATGIALAVGQLPQPWRVGMVTWLLVGMPLLLCVGRVVVRAARYRAARPHQGNSRTTSGPRPARRPAGALHVVLSDSAGSGRYVIR